MYENESYESRAQSESDWLREERDRDAFLERQEARARRELAEGLIELSEFTGQLPRPVVSNVAAPISDALENWLKAMSANAWGYAPLFPRSEVVAADPLGYQTARKAVTPAQRPILSEGEAA